MIRVEQQGGPLADLENQVRCWYFGTLAERLLPNSLWGVERRGFASKDYYIEITHFINTASQAPKASGVCW